MIIEPGTIGLVAAVFVASAVECVEAFTIVLAMGMTRSWRSAITGTVLALIALGALTAIVGVGMQTYISRSFLQLLIGCLLLIFGLQWLRNAILRSSGLKSLHDQDSIFEREKEAASKAGKETRFGLDWFAFVVSFKGMFLEGLEVVFIVITFGLSASGKEPDAMFIASMGALAAVAVVFIVGIIVKGPLSKVPENTLKFAVAVLLSTFGLFWSAEGLGFFSPDKQSIEWPGGDWALPGVLFAWIVVSYVAVVALRKISEMRSTQAATEKTA